MCEKKDFTRVFFVIFNKNSNASKLKEQFEQSFEKKNAEVKLFTFTREECLKYFDVDETEDDIEVIESIMTSKVMRNYSGRTALFLDETSLSRSNNNFDWSKLENSDLDICLIISFQPMVEAFGSNKKPIQLQLPSSNHVNINLTRCYRTSTSILRSLQSFHDLSIRRLETQEQAVNLISGCKPTLLTYSKVNANLKIWLHMNLLKLRCKKEQVTIIYTDETKNDAFKMFNDSEFFGSLIHWKEFVGCERHIIICFYSSLEYEWYLFHITSRAQQQVNICNI